MWPVIRRAALPMLLVGGGLASLIYGAIFHYAPVVEERETETTIDVPAPFSPGPFGGPQFGGPPPFVKKTVKRVDTVTVEQSEPSLTREVTVGGVARLPSGEIKQTYSGDAGPALCPT